MTQKEINESIGMAMLRVCGLVWLHLTSNPNMGKFAMKDVLDGIDGRNREKSKPGFVAVEFHGEYLDDHINEEFYQALMDVDGVKQCDRASGELTLSVPTNDGNHFECGFFIYEGVFRMVYRWLYHVGCNKMVSKTFFGVDADGRYALLPDGTEMRANNGWTMDDKSEVLATIKFDADKVLPKLKKCLETNDLRPVMCYPAIELRTGVMIASDGHILAVHKLSGYSYTVEDKVELDDTLQMIPIEVLNMQGAITVEVRHEDYQNVIVAHDEQGNYGKAEMGWKYPNWRGAMPTKTGAAVEIDCKRLDKAAKMMAKGKESIVQVDAEPFGKSLILGKWDAINGEVKMSQGVPLTEAIPYKMSAQFRVAVFRTMLALAPTTMRFASGNRPVMFGNEDTLTILMPVVDSKVCLDPREMFDFDLDGWIGAKTTAATAKTAAKTAKVVKASKPKTTKAKTVKVEPVHELSMAERLRQVLLGMMRKAA